MPHDGIEFYLATADSVVFEGKISERHASSACCWLEVLHEMEPVLRATGEGGDRRREHPQVLSVPRH